MKFNIKILRDVKNKFKKITNIRNGDFLPRKFAIQTTATARYANLI